jgi:integrase
VFTLAGETPSPTAAYKAFRRAARAAAVLPEPRFHDTRHAYATHMLAAGLSAHAVAELLGHSDAGLVWRRYGHALPDEIATGAERLSAWRAAQAR